MKYELRISAPTGDIVPLLVVAASKAQARAMAGGTEFHEPAYQGSFKGFAEDLLREAKAGRLRVCDRWGGPSSADELLSVAERDGLLQTYSRFLVEPDWEKLHRENPPVSPGAWNLSHLDLGPSEIDWTKTHLAAMFATLKSLNAWAAGRGDEFAINHDGVGWGDERGWVAPPTQLDLEADAVQPDSSPVKPIPRHSAQEDEIVAALKRRGYEVHALPSAPAGKSSPAKRAARDALDYSEAVFDKAWQRLRKDGRIREA